MRSPRNCRLRHCSCEEIQHIFLYVVHNVDINNLTLFFLIPYFYYYYIFLTHGRNYTLQNLFRTRKLSNFIYLLFLLLFLLLVFVIFVVLVFFTVAQNVCFAMVR